MRHAGQTDVRHGCSGPSLHRRGPSKVSQLHVQMLFHGTVDGSPAFLYGLRTGGATDIRR